MEGKAGLDGNGQFLSSMAVFVGYMGYQRSGCRTQCTEVEDVGQEACSKFHIQEAPQETSRDAFRNRILSSVYA